MVVIVRVEEGHAVYAVCGSRCLARGECCGCDRAKKHRAICPRLLALRSHIRPGYIHRLAKNTKRPTCDALSTESVFSDRSQDLPRFLPKKTKQKTGTSHSSSSSGREQQQHGREEAQAHRPRRGRGWSRSVRSIRSSSSSGRQHDDCQSLHGQAVLEPLLRDPGEAAR